MKLSHKRILRFLKGYFKMVAKCVVSIRCLRLTGLDLTGLVQIQNTDVIMQKRN